MKGKFCNIIVTKNTSSNVSYYPQTQASGVHMSVYIIKETQLNHHNHLHHYNAYTPETSTSKLTAKVYVHHETSLASSIKTLKQHEENTTGCVLLRLVGMIKCSL